MAELVRPVLTLGRLLAARIHAEQPRCFTEVPPDTPERQTDNPAGWVRGAGSQINYTVLAEFVADRLKARSETLVCVDPMGSTEDSFVSRLEIEWLGYGREIYYPCRPANATPAAAYEAIEATANAWIELCVTTSAPVPTSELEDQDLARIVIEASYGMVQGYDNGPWIYAEFAA